MQPLRMGSRAEPCDGLNRLQRRNAKRKAERAAAKAPYDRRCAELASIRRRAEEEERLHSQTPSGLQTRLELERCSTAILSPLTLQRLLGAGGLSAAGVADLL